MWQPSNTGSKLRPAAATSLFLLILSITVSTSIGVVITVSSDNPIQEALNAVGPGDVVEIEAGQYFEDIYTTVDGTASAPITIRGVDGKKDDVILRGAGDSSRIFEIRHDYYIIEDFTIDGESDNVDDPNYRNKFRNKLLYAEARRSPTTRSGGYRSSLDGLIVRNMNLRNAGVECMRLKYFLTFASIYGNSITRCGIYDFDYENGGKNGEGIYLGTSSTQWDDNYTNEPDVCYRNHIYDNYIKTDGSEGVDIKEGSFQNLVEDNGIYMQLDPDSGGVESRGDKTVIRYNHIEDCTGAGVRLGGHIVDGTQYGVDNDVYQNTMVNTLHSGIKIMVLPQGIICDNDITTPSRDIAEDFENVRGPGDDVYTNSEGACSELGSSPFDEEATVPPATSTVEETTPAPSTLAPTMAPTERQAPGIIGCFQDKVSSRIMETIIWRSRTKMTTAECSSRCRKAGHKYSGIDKGRRCWCGDDDDYDRHGQGTCEEPCTGATDEICGDKTSLTVSRT